MSSPYKFRWAITRTIPSYLIFLLITSPAVIPFRNVVINAKRRRNVKRRGHCNPEFFHQCCFYIRKEITRSRKVLLVTIPKVSYKKYNDFNFSFLWKNPLKLERILKCNTVKARHLIYRSTHLHMHIHMHIFIRIIASFYESEYLWEEFPPEITIIVTRRDARTANRDRYSSTLSGIHFARMFVYRAINSTNAKCGKLMSAASTWTRELRLACVIPLNYSRNPVSSSSPIQTRLGPGTTPYTLSAIKIKCLYKVNRHRRKTALMRSAENVNWFGRNN